MLSSRKCRTIILYLSNDKRKRKVINNKPTLQKRNAGYYFKCLSIKYYFKSLKALSSSAFSAFVPIVTRKQSLHRRTRVRLRTMMPCSTR